MTSFEGGGRILPLVEGVAFVLEMAEVDEVITRVAPGAHRSGLALSICRRI